MDSSNLELRLSELRRELEEILLMIEATPSAAARANQQREASLSNLGDAEHETSQPAKPCDADASVPDELYDDALVVVTEFGQASHAILQMWLSIDYHRAGRILREFEAQGLVSSRGKVRHKAYGLRRSKGMEFRL
ncbi:MAG: DNA translocase FtsK [Acidobacteriota bacterium]